VHTLKRVGDVRRRLAGQEHLACPADDVQVSFIQSPSHEQPREQTVLWVVDAVKSSTQLVQQRKYGDLAGLPLVPTQSVCPARWLHQARPQIQMRHRHVACNEAGTLLPDALPSFKQVGSLAYTREIIPKHAVCDRCQIR